MNIFKYKIWKANIQKATVLFLSAAVFVSSPLCAYADQGPGVSAGQGDGQPVLTPGESYYQYQWGLKNDGNIRRISYVFSAIPIRRGPGEIGWLGAQGQMVREVVTDSVNGIDINVEPAWDYYEQSTSRRTVTVALIDTGVDITHSDLAGSIWVNEDEIAGDGIDNDGNGYIDDVNGWNFYSNNNQVFAGDEDDHGTHGAGTIAGAWNGQGMAQSVKDAIRYAQANGADICNLSMGTSSYDPEMEALMQNSSMLFVVSAGNGDNWGRGYNIDYWPVYPAAYTGDNSITVANLMFNGSLDESSNFGTFSVDIAAPGTYILSTTPGGYGFMSGTSMAAPMVTGVAALVYSCRTDLSLMDVRQAILASAKPMEEMAGKLTSGGILDAYGAITYGLAVNGG